MLLWAAAHSRLSLMRDLLQLSADVDGGVGVDTRNCMGMMTLYSGVIRRHLCAVEICISLFLSTFKIPLRCRINRSQSHPIDTLTHELRRERNREIESELEYSKLKTENDICRRGRWQIQLIEKMTSEMGKGVARKKEQN